MLKEEMFLVYPQRSKFDSDEEDEVAENLEGVSSGKVTRSPSPAPQKSTVNQR